MSINQNIIVFILLNIEENENFISYLCAKALESQKQQVIMSCTYSMIEINAQQYLDMENGSFFNAQKVIHLQYSSVKHTFPLLS